MKITSGVSGSGSRNHLVVVKGTLEEDLKDPVEVMKWDLPSPPKIQSIAWLVQEKMGLVLWWDEGEDFIVMESRNLFVPPQAIVPPANWGKSLRLTSFGVKSNEYFPKRFWFCINIDK